MATSRSSRSARRVGWGVIGSTGIADKRTIPGMLLSPRSRLVAVVDSSLQRARPVATKYQCKACSSLDQMLADPEVDAVYIASPVFLHSEQAMRAADAGKHILCEKPLAPSVPEARRLVDHCRRRGVHLAVGFMMRFHTIHQRLRKWVDDGRLGRIIMARAQLSHFHVEHNPDGSPNWRQDPSKSGGGALMDMGIHCVDLLRYIIGREVVDVSARIETLENTYAIEDTGVLLFSFDDGAVGIVDSTFAARGAQHVLELYGTNGSAFVDNSISQVEEGTLRFSDGRSLRKVPVKRPRNYKYSMYTSEVDALNQAILHGKPLPADPRDALIAQAVVQTGYRAAAAGRKLSIRIP